MRIEPCEPSPNAVSGGGNGVIHMGLLNIIRRMALREKQSIREIKRVDDMRQFDRSLRAPLT
ncbi:hypothetical protein EHH54_40145 [Rhizobium leguminosarum]|nr:hypothetical protein EHH54_40145 [Rhizobium leguminosarum]